VEGNTMSRLNQILACIVLLACLHWVSAAPGKVIYVDDDATGANDGSSWNHAFTRLQGALAVAAAGDEIRVAQGTYRPDPGTEPPTRGRTRSPQPVALAAAADAPYPSFPLLNGVALRGGFAGCGAEDPNARDVVRYETILSGDVKGDDKPEWDPWYPLSKLFQSDNSLHVVTSTKTDANAILDGFTLTAAMDSALRNDNGGPTIVDCTFRRNAGQSGGGLKSVGGQPTVSRCTFVENSSSTDGGAIYTQKGALTLTECRFSLNAAANRGGGISSQDSALSLGDCLFEQNAAEAGGAVSHYLGTLNLTGSRFEGNLALGGGAILLMDAQATVVTECTFKANWAENTGGAVYKQGSARALNGPVTLERCTFTANAAARAGALFVTGVYPVLGDTLTLGNCLFTGNRAADSGGAICGDQSRLTITGCTFAGNRAPMWATLDWRYYLWLAGDAPAVHMTNCIVWDGETAIFRSFDRWDGQTVDANDVVTIAYTDVQGGWPGAGNIDADPCFAAPGDWDPNGTPEAPNEDVWVEGDYHLKSQAGRWDPLGESWVLDEVTSPCIDAGDPNSPVGDEPEPNGGRVNMGAYGGTGEASKSYQDKP
jgi:predicted outer membrane repeat protein